MRASLRAMTRKSSLRRAAQATSIFRTISPASITSRPSVWPQRLGCTWSSIWRAEAPASSYSRVVRRTFRMFPKPVSASAMIGSETARRSARTPASISSQVVSPTSGTPTRDAETP